MRSLGEADGAQAQEKPNLSGGAGTRFQQPEEILVRLLRRLIERSQQFALEDAQRVRGLRHARFRRGRLSHGPQKAGSKSGKRDNNGVSAPLASMRLLASQARRASGMVAGVVLVSEFEAAARIGADLRLEQGIAANIEREGGSN